MLSYTFIHSLIPLICTDHLLYDRHCSGNIAVKRTDQDPYLDGVHCLIFLEEVMRQPIIQGDGSNQNTSSRGRKVRSAENLHFKEESHGERCKGDKGASYTDIWKKSIPENKNRITKDLGSNMLEIVSKQQESQS